MKIKSILFCFCLMNIALAESTQRYDRDHAPFRTKKWDSAIVASKTTGGTAAGMMLLGVAMELRDQKHRKKLVSYEKEILKLEDQAVDKHQFTHEKFRHISEKIKDIEARLNGIKIEKATVRVDLENAQKFVALDKSDKFSEIALLNRSKVDEAKLKLAQLQTEIKRLKDVKLELRQDMLDKLKEDKLVSVPKAPKKAKISKLVKGSAALLILQAAEVAYYKFETDHEVRKMPFAMIAEDISRVLEANKDCKDFDESQKPSEAATAILKTYCTMIADSGRNNELSKEYNDIEEDIEIEDAQEKGSSLN